MFRSIANASWRAFSAGTRPSFHKFKTEIPRLSISTQLNLRAGFATQHPRREDLCDEKPMIGPGEELAFAWITPRSLIKGLEGGIMARLLSIPNIQLIGARMFCPSDAFVDEYIDIHMRTYRPLPFMPFVEYIDTNLRPIVRERLRIPNNFLFMIFKGKNVRQELSKTIGEYLPDPRVGMVGRTIRGAYGDFIRQKDGTITHFQPAIVGASSDEANRLYLKLFSKYLQTDGGTFDEYYDQLDIHKNYQTGMVMIKPDMLERPSSLPGHIMDLFGSTGLHLVGARVFSFSVAQAQAFYGFLEEVFVEKLRPKLESRIRTALDKEFDGKIKISDVDYDVITTILKRKAAKAEVDNIIEYMSGIHPSTVHTEQERRRPGPARCLALLYRGANAIETIRAKLGSTDPSKAAVGTIRSDYGRDIMKNGAHASDSEASLVRERSIIGFSSGAPSITKRTIDVWLAMNEDTTPQDPRGPRYNAVSHVSYKIRAKDVHEAREQAADMLSAFGDEYRFYEKIAESKDDIANEIVAADANLSTLLTSNSQEASTPEPSAAVEENSESSSESSSSGSEEENPEKADK